MAREKVPVFLHRTKVASRSTDSSRAAEDLLVQRERERERERGHKQRGCGADLIRGYDLPAGTGTGWY
jgi:hypothetical protein